MMNRATLALFASSLLAVAACKSTGDEPSASAPAPTAPPAAAPAAPAPAPAASTLLAEGAMAPSVTGKTHDGKEISLDKLRGKPIVLYFYPKDDTAGCTLEAQSFEEATPSFAGVGATVIGVSMDSLDSHQAFATKYNLKFPLLSDTDGAIAAKFGVDTSSGKAKRTTFVIGSDGKIAKVFADVKVDGHDDEVLAAVNQLAAK